MGMWEVVGHFSDGTPINLFSGDWRSLLNEIVDLARPGATNDQVRSLRDALDGFTVPAPSGCTYYVSADRLTFQIVGL